MRLLQPGQGAPTQSGLLGGRDACGRTAKNGVRAAPYFDKNPFVTVSHDEINLAEAACDLSRHEHKACGLQIGKRLVFTGITDTLGRGALQRYFLLSTLLACSRSRTGTMREGLRDTDTQALQPPQRRFATQGKVEQSE